MFSSLKWIPIHDRIKYHNATILYKSVNDLAPKSIKDIVYMCA